MFSSHALALEPINQDSFCSSFNYSSDKEKCNKLTLVDQYTTSLCSKLYYANDKLECANIFSSKSSSTAAAETCDGLYYDSKKLECANIIAGAYFTDSAVQICKDLNYDSDKSKCLENIKGKAYSFQETEVCSEEFYTSKKIECLTNSGRFASSVPTPDSVISWDDFKLEYSSYFLMTGDYTDTWSIIGKVKIEGLTTEQANNYIALAASTNRECAVGASQAYLDNDGLVTWNIGVKSYQQGSYKCQGMLRIQANGHIKDHPISISLDDSRRRN